MDVFLRLRHRAAPASILAVAVLLASSAASAEGSWKAGLARADITPTKPLWLHKYGHPADRWAPDVEDRVMGAVLCTTATATPPAPLEDHGTWPREQAVQRDDAAGLLTLSTPFYEVQHDLRRGGAIARIRYPHGRASNLLVRPLEARIQDGAGGIFSDLNDAAARVTLEKAAREGGPVDVVTVESGLLDAQDRASGVRIRTAFEYRWGFIKARREFRFPAGLTRLKVLCPVSIAVAPNLTDFGWREGTTEKEGAQPFSFGSCRWDRMVDPARKDPLVETPFIPRYVVFADPGVEGLEWFVGSDLSQWDLEVEGKRGQGLCRLAYGREPEGLTLTICPVHRTGDAVAFAGSLAFDFHIGLSILDGRATPP